MARQWAKLGATIVLWDRDEAGLAAARDFILQTGASAVHTYTCDLTDRDAVRSVGEQVLEEVGPIDVLVNNAGIVSGKSLLEISDEEIVRTFEVNSLALFGHHGSFFRKCSSEERVISSPLLLQLVSSAYRSSPIIARVNGPRLVLMSLCGWNSTDLPRSKDDRCLSLLH